MYTDFLPTYNVFEPGLNSEIEWITLGIFFQKYINVNNSIPDSLWEMLLAKAQNTTTCH